MKKTLSPSARSCDVEYRVVRLQQTLSDAIMFLNAIDPVVFPEQHAAMHSALTGAASLALGLKVPEKKRRRNVEEKQAVEPSTPIEG